jgi:hypothetical protein
MSDRVKRKHPALKHGAYSATAVLPGEDPVKFEKLRRDLIAEYCPDGPLENHIVEDLARLIWRSENLSIFRIAKIAREPFVDSEERPRTYSETTPNLERFQVEQCAAAVRAEEDEARKKLGDLYELVAMGEIATIPYMLSELRLQERFDDLIDRCIKRLLHAKGLKSISKGPDLVPARQLSASPKAA